LNELPLKRLAYISSSFARFYASVVNDQIGLSPPLAIMSGRRS
jgi:hypothetical protein